VQSLGNGTAFSALAPSQRPAVAAHRSRNVRNQNPRTFATANIQCILTANSALLIEFEIIELEMAPEVEIVED